MNYIDIHAHLNFPEYDGDRVAVIKRTLEAGVGVINIGTDKKTSAEVVKLAEENENMWAAIGAHPHSIEEGFDYEFYKKLALNPKVVAIGECGLDRGGKLEVESWKEQIPLFEQQIKLAVEVGKPLMIHCRNAYQEVLDILYSNLQSPTSNLHSHFHFFAGSWDIAKKILDRGDTLSFTGVITFSHDYDEVIKNTPLDKIMAETDAPYVAPVPYRGQRNEPLYVTEVYKKIAELKGLSAEEVASVIVANAQKVFKLG